ncbi:unnamed protein product [Ostreobium quekettii]|uniref:Uncharacterized protein n=1 Tax=Ostreobium quekettii TaxID=121088 RepID=A0A8S1IJT3_9CHLO|nr:unnamed protein product [Ostreobium quekettii]
MINLPVPTTVHRAASLPTLCLACLASLALAPPALAVTVNLGDSSLFPGSAEVIVATPAQGAFGQDAAISLAQSFSVDNAFSLQSIFLEYENDSNSPGDKTLTMSIFEVADVNAVSLAEPPLEADILFSDSVTFPFVSSSTVAQIGLDSPLSLSPSVGASGYAIHFGGTTAPGWEWLRTTNNTGADVYSGGKAYQDGPEKSSGTRDFTLALSSDAPPLPPIDAFSVQSGDLLAGSTWDNSIAPVGAAPTPNYVHNIVNGHAVTADGSQDYNGAQVSVVDGELTYTASGVQLPMVSVSEGATVVETTTGEFFLGDIGATDLGQMELNGRLTITAEGGADAALDMVMAGAGTAEVNVEAGGNLFITDLSQFNGALQFNGSGDQVLYEGPSGAGATIEMNSTGTNRLAWNLTSGGAASSNVVFNEPGVFDHQTTESGPRLGSPGEITANASVEVDMTKTYVGQARRLLTGISGAGAITVNGTPSDPTNTTADIGLNEFEMGGTAERVYDTNNFTGTLTANDFVNVEVRSHLSGGTVVVNQNALLDVGHDSVENFFSTRVGSITVNSGGALEISGAAANQFDTITSEGTVSLGGVLELLIDPTLTAGTTHATQGTYVPSDGDTFEIISIGAEVLPGDYDANGTVGPEDYDLWVATFGSESDVTADGNLDGVVDAADYTVWRDNAGASGAVTGSIVGDFSSMVIVDPGNVLAGFEVTKSVTTGVGGNVTLTVNAIPGAGVASAPEPSSLLLAGLSAGAAGGLVGRRRRFPAQMEQQALYDSIDKSVDWYHPNNEVPSTTPLPMMRCPSRGGLEPVTLLGPGNTNGEGFGDWPESDLRTHYLAVLGANTELSVLPSFCSDPSSPYTMETETSGSSSRRTTVKCIDGTQGPIANSGVIYRFSDTRMGEVIDGTSNTFLWGESAFGIIEDQRTRAWIVGATNVFMYGAKNVAYSINSGARPGPSRNNMGFGFKPRSSRQMEKRDWLLGKCVLIAAFVGVAVGCGQSSHELDTAPVSGRITLDGEPLPQGIVYVIPDKGRMAKALVKEDGTFELSTYHDGDGAQVGNHAAVVAALPPDELNASQKQTRVAVPKRYTQASTSGLTVNVEAGKTNEVEWALSTAANAASVTVKSIETGGSFPANPEIAVASLDEATFGDDADTSLAQSFTVVDPFSLNSIYLAYQNDDRDPGDKTLTMTIFKVADADAPTHDEPPMPGDVILTESVTFPYVESTDTVATIALDASLALESGSYMLRFSGTTNPGWEWFRTTNSSGSVYAGGQGYENGGEKGNRDFALALSSVPAPSSAALMLSAALATILWRKS